MNKHEKLIYKNERGQDIEFSVWSPFFAEKVSGIDSLKNVIYSTKGMGQDGSTFTGSTLNDRNIVIQGTILKNKLTNKSKLLTIVNIKIKGNLFYENQYIKKYIECKVESISVIPTKGKYVFQISLLANDPFWKDINKTKKQIALWKGNFHFPLIIPSNKGIMMGHREPSLIVNVNNTGDVKTGMTIEFFARGTLKNPSLFNVNTREYLKINKGMIAGEKITINTNFNNKKIEDNLNGITTDILNYIDLGGGDTFLQLDIGDNLFRYNADENLDNLEVNIYFNPKYLGV